MFEIVTVKPEKLGEYYKEENKSEVTGHGRMPNALLAYERAYYRDRLYNTFFTIHEELRSEELAKEYDEVIRYFNEHLPTYDDEVRYAETVCTDHVSDKEHNIYAVGTNGLYWIRFTLVPGDYHRRIYCFKKD